MLKFRVENLGSVRQGEFTQKNLTIFCGPNNTGKTWVMYSLYQFWHYMNIRDDILRESDESREINLDDINDALSESLPDLFNCSRKLLKDSRFELLKEDAGWDRLTEVRKEGLGPAKNILLMPAERGGLHLFFRELSTRRTALLHHASQEKIDLYELLRDVIRSRYAIPIAHYIDWLNDMTETQKKPSSNGLHIYAEQLKREVVKGAYRVDAQSGDIEFRPYKIRGSELQPQNLGLHMTSSTVKSLFGLWFYLEHQAKKGDLLMIDEPELNIHPENQRKMARLLARLANAGLNIAISTHSDYIVREFNSLIMLSQDASGELREKHQYLEDEALRLERVGAYLFDHQEITPFEITPDDGIYATTFDEVIKDLNKVNDDIYYTLQERKSEN